MSNQYEKFATIYDELMEEAPYSKWVQVIENAFNKQNPQSTRLLELGAGTGTLALKLAEKGFQMTLSDYSPEMLTICEQKLRNIGSARDIPLYLIDMSDFELEETFDGVLIFCDALNYLPDEASVQATLQNVYRHLNPGGLLLFDVHSTCKIDAFISQQTFGSSDPNLSYIWECFAGVDPHSVIHDLTFFIPDQSGTYSRFEETHEQRTYPLSFYLNLLEKVGFHKATVVGDFNSNLPLDQSERWIFSAKKG